MVWVVSAIATGVFVAGLGAIAAMLGMYVPS
jgi:hypothetical protein